MNDMESRKFEDAFKRAFDEAGVSPSENVWTNIERTLDDAESRKFAGTFQQAFDEAGVRPSENVWTNIELDLMKAEGGRLKRRLVFFQLLAAASIAFALAVAGVGYYILKDQELTGAAGQLAYQEGATGTDRHASAPTPADDSGEEVSQGTTSASGARTDAQQVQPGATDIAPVAAGGQETDPATPQTDSRGVNAASPVTQSDITPGVAATRSGNGSDTNSVARTNTPAGSGDTQAQTALAGTVGTAATRSSTTQHNHTATQPNNPAARQIAVRQDAQRRRATETGGTDPSRDSRPDQGRAVNDQQTLATNNAGSTSNDGLQPAQIGETGVAVAHAKEADAIRKGAIVANGNQRTDNTGNNNAVTPNSTTTSPAAAAGQQTEYRLAYSPAPAHATPEVTSLGARVQKPASMKVEPASTVDPLMALLARLDEQEKDANAKEKKNKREDEEHASEKLWTSVGFAAGSFNTINSSVSNSSGNLMMADARKDAVDKVANQQAKASGSSYSVGVSMGTRISSRWVLQGGINYMTQASDYTASAVGTADYESFQAPSVNSIMSADKQAASTEFALENVVPTAPYNVNNSLQFVSVPLQAGYLLVNRKVGIQLNGGLATDLFIQNTITPEGENLQKETKGNGSDSPYRTVNFSGLMGTEFSYRFSKHYRLSLNPGIRYPLNSIYKSDQPVTAAPLTFDVGLRFRYIFH
ncbi:outer membrane beta-barrel protein [Dawidia soli]|uniref:Outer membrane beta-barrel protein n=1 Tax=Dawidia soli TaxID=2782352 RepID=A0AAP2DC26_9BACT|nr:outer membrane beta-barrel protein [Dawidia soli]MBT1686592.1 outer membrane beta-barrel protein [Dawidia soli]